MKNLTKIMLVLTTLGCGGEAYEEDAELDVVVQPTIAACLKDDGNIQYGVQDTQAPWTRCNPSVNMQCTLPGTKRGYEMAMSNAGATWSSGDKLEWGIGGQKAATFLYNSFTAWQGLSTHPTRFNVNTFNTEIPGISTAAQLLQVPDYIEFRKQSFAEPSWYANRANTTSALLTDLAKMQCVSRIALTDTNSASWSRCTKWIARVDYDRMRGWTLARNVSVQPLIESVTKKLGVWSMGLAPGSGSGLTVTDSKVYVSGTSTNPTTFVNGTFGSEVSWVNNYELTGELRNPTVDACILACGFNNTCADACRNTLHCELE